MKYSALFTESAEKDIEAAARYIESTLHNPSAAENLLKDVSLEIRNLEDNPFICSIIDDPGFKSIGLRASIVRNYLLFYTVSSNDKTILILRFLFGRRNWRWILGQRFAIE